MSRVLIHLLLLDLHLLAAFLGALERLRNFLHGLFHGLVLLEDLLPMNVQLILLPVDFAQAARALLLLMLYVSLLLLQPRDLRGEAIPDILYFVLRGSESPGKIRLLLPLHAQPLKDLLDLLVHLRPFRLQLLDLRSLLLRLALDCVLDRSLLLHDLLSIKLEVLELVGHGLHGLCKSLLLRGRPRKRVARPSAESFPLLRELLLQLH
mmetsp:Transcript_15453/g.51877  ORF Transcript_15453/g.51877 Transcript_15453/m.51877 type:complete len:208 (+) Transcript_15453:769-1392(+)